MKSGQLVEIDRLDAERQVILDAAARLFERYGYKKTTVEDIAQEAQIGKGTVYLRFASKEEIGLAWLHSLHESVATALEPIPDATPAQQLRHTLVQRVMIRFDIFTEHQRSLDEALCSLRSQVEAKKKAFHEEEATFIAAQIARGRMDGTLHSADPLQDARSMVLATNTLMPYKLRPDQLGERGDVQAQAEHLADLLIRGVTPANV